MNLYLSLCCFAELHGFLSWGCQGAQSRYDHRIRPCPRETGDTMRYSETPEHATVLTECAFWNVSRRSWWCLVEKSVARRDTETLRREWKHWEWKLGICFKFSKALRGNADWKFLPGTELSALNVSLEFGNPHFQNSLKNPNLEKTHPRFCLGHGIFRQSLLGRVLWPTSAGWGLGCNDKKSLLSQTFCARPRAPFESVRRARRPKIRWHWWKKRCDHSAPWVGACSHVGCVCETSNFLLLPI